MLVLTGRTVSVDHDSYVNKRDQLVETHKLLVGVEGGSLWCDIPHQLFVRLGAARGVLEAFGSQVSIICEPAMLNVNFQRVPAVSALAVQVVGEDGEVHEIGPAGHLAGI